MREKLIDIVEAYADFLDWDTKEEMVDSIMEFLATDNNVGHKWIPVTERLPKPYVDVITLRQDLLSKNYHAVGLEYVTLRGEANIPAWSKDHLTWKNKVTHWMPLPEPPKGE